MGYREKYQVEEEQLLSEFAKNNVKVFRPGFGYYQYIEDVEPEVDTKAYENKTMMLEIGVKL